MRQPTDYTYRGSVAMRFFGLIIVAAIGALVFFPVDQRPAILRVALAIALVTAFLHLVGRLIEAVRDDSSSGFARALKAPPVPVRLDTALVQLGDEVRYSRSSRRYFDKILWPRLRALIPGRAGRPEELPPPAPSDLLGMRGPSLKSLSDIVDRLERLR
jgi:hypothetical protein